VRAAPRPAAPPSPAGVVPDFSSRLRALGYSRQEISEIKPSVARVVVRRSLPRPQSGMPESWKSDEAKRRPKPPPFAFVRRVVVRPIARAARATTQTTLTMLKYAVPAGVVVVVGAQAAPLAWALATRLREAAQAWLAKPREPRPKPAEPPRTLPRGARIVFARPAAVPPRRSGERPAEAVAPDGVPAPRRSDPAPAPAPPDSPPVAPTDTADDDFVLDGPDDASIRRRK